MVRSSVRAAAIVLPLALLGCMLPSERGGELRIVLQAPPYLFLGDTARLSASLQDAGGAAIPNARFRVEVDNPAILGVAERSDGVTLLSRTAGTTSLIVTAVGVGQVPSVTQGITVYGTVAVDSVTPRSALHWGDTLTIYGVGLDPSAYARVLIGGKEAPIHRFTPTDATRPSGFAKLVVFVPPGAAPASPIQVIGTASVALGPTLNVYQFDLYEPNDAAPFDLGVLAAGFANPALAQEARLRSDTLVPWDWYLLRGTHNGDWTVEYSGFVQLEEGDVLFPRPDTMFLPYDSVTTDTIVLAKSAVSWWNRSTFYTNCQGWGFGAGALSDDTVRVSLHSAPMDTLELVTIYPYSTTTRGYYAAIRPGYTSSIAPDAYETNDYCAAATPLTLDAAALQLNLDRPHDVDWFRFTIPSPGRTVRILAQFPNNDLDILVFTDPVGWVDYAWYGVSADSAQEEVIADLPAGNYLMYAYSWLRAPGTYTLGLTTYTGTAPPLRAPAHRPPVRQLASSVRGALPTRALRGGRTR